MKYIDVSHHNTITDYKAVAKDVDGAFVRLSYGSTGVDRKGIVHAEGLHEAGVPVGLYFYSYATKSTDAPAEVENFFKQLSLLSFIPELPLCRLRLKNPSKSDYHKRQTYRFPYMIL